ncbi:vesicle-associated membrane protein 3 isoform X2 [Equus quagga]|uniref:vesicle-associated membrane protein 3 isoform X2 n=1 Tax=Equus quagga TaxID=89248 RepID=UPI001EE2DD01|nr:vesicle-associated membrane protein 3 isoform X2 [Equus quagga]
MDVNALYHVKEVPFCSWFAECFHHEKVVDIMRVNVDKVLERDQKLSELDDRADALQAGASQFETSAAKLKRKYWWKNCKMWAIGISVVVIIIIIIIVWSFS